MQLQKDRYERKDLTSVQKDALKLLFEKKSKLKELISSFFDCLMKEHDRGNEKSNGEKKEKALAIGIGKEISKKKNNYISDKHFASDQGNQEDDEVEAEGDEA